MGRVSNEWKGKLLSIKKEILAVEDLLAQTKALLADKTYMRTKTVERRLKLKRKEVYLTGRLKGMREVWGICGLRYFKEWQEEEGA